jgi:hypothetical protein
MKDAELRLTLAALRTDLVRRATADLKRTARIITHRIVGRRDEIREANNRDEKAEQHRPQIFLAHVSPRM